MRDWKLLNELEHAETILLAGAGGGFDLFHVIPLYMELRRMGKKVVFANFSFAHLHARDNECLTAHAVKVTKDSVHGTYAPEHAFVCWHKEYFQEDVSVYAYHSIGVEPLVSIFNKLNKNYKLDAVVLVDGGTDSLMTGDEFLLGTPSEDVVSMLAADLSTIPAKYLMCIGFGIDTYHGVCHAQFLESVANLTQAGAALGVVSVLPDSDQADAYASAVIYANDRHRGQESIVASSILSAIEGNYGDHHTVPRTHGSKLWINPLMSLCWAFSLPAVVKNIKYKDRILSTKTLHDVVFHIERYRASITPKPWESMPH